MSEVHINHLQSVLNASARLVFAAHKSDHVISLLCDLHWLKVTEIIQFRLCGLVYRCLRDAAPAYLADSLHLAAYTDVHPRLHSAGELMLLILSTHRLVIVHLRWLQPELGTLCCCLFVRYAPTFSIFCRQLKTLQFTYSFQPEP